MKRYVVFMIAIQSVPTYGMVAKEELVSLAGDRNAPNRCIEYKIQPNEKAANFFCNKGLALILQQQRARYLAEDELILASFVLATDLGNIEACKYVADFYGLLLEQAEKAPCSSQQAMDENFDEIMRFANEVLYYRHLYKSLYRKKQLQKWLERKSPALSGAE